jgi:hypothetical protein
MVLQMHTRSFTRESEGMALVTNCASPPVLGHMTVRRIAVHIATVHFRRRCHDLVFQIGPRLNRGGDVRRRTFLIHTYEHGCNRIQELIGVRLFYRLGSGGRNRFGDFLRRRSEEPSSEGDKGSCDKSNENGRKPRPGSIRFHRCLIGFRAIIEAAPPKARKFMQASEIDDLALPAPGGQPGTALFLQAEKFIFYS